ncbi:MAG: hypothetical protein MUF31_13045 [Akkermansiaceae bacterium]|jgi:hypothetical protein|nr:hypothetical protein [Akkermansiaceae bacterium]
MKPIAFLLPLALVACAPKATLVEEAPAPTTASTTPAEKKEEAETLPEVAAGDNLGLLDPKDIGKLPSSQDMRPTVDTASTKPVMVTPPSDKPAVSAE